MPATAWALKFRAILVYRTICDGQVGPEPLALIVINMYGKKGILPGILIVVSIVLLILNIVKDGSIYGILSNILLIIGMVFVLVGIKKKKEID